MSWDWMEMLQPSLRHAREERERLELTVDHPDSGAPPLGIDLDAGTARFAMPTRTVASARAAVIATAADRVVRLKRGRVAVVVDGPTAAGKTTFADELGAAIADRGRPVLRAGLDHFKHPWSERHEYDRTSGEGYYRNAYDYRMLTELLLDPFCRNRSDAVPLAGIDPVTGEDESATRALAAPDAVLVVDGVFAFRPEIDHYWDLRIWLDVDVEHSLSRGLARDAGRPGNHGEAVYRERYLASERLYVEEVDPVRRADLVIDNRDVDRPWVRAAGSYR